jgi:ribosomal protein L32E
MKELRKLPQPREAIEIAEEIATNQRSEVIVHGKDGRIRSKDSYGRDPFPPRDTEH